MSQTQIKRIWVGGAVNINQQLGRDFPHTFFEIDTADKTIHEVVLTVYKKHNLDVISQRVGKGYHYFGGHADRQLWKEWYSDLKHFNPLYPPLTLRITKKFIDEVWERPVFHEAKEVVPNWSKAVMSFLNKSIGGTNNVNIHKAMNHAGLPKYFRCVVYPVEVNHE